MALCANDQPKNGRKVGFSLVKPTLEELLGCLPFAKYQKFIGHGKANYPHYQNGGGSWYTGTYPG